jgi:arylsulfatase A-like enzyme
MHRQFTLVLVTIAFLGCAGARYVPREKSVRVPSKPNIVFVLADDLGAHDVGFAGAKFFETPNLDRMAAEGMIFDRAYTCGPNCAPTRGCLISGMYTPRHHIYTPGRLSKGPVEFMKLLVPARKARSSVSYPPSKSALDPSVVSFAEVLKTQGYVTGHFGKWHVGPDAQGFDVTSSNGKPGLKRRHYGNIHVADKLTDAGLAFIDENKDRPFFLYLSHWDVHTPIRAKPEVVAKYRQKLAKTGGKHNVTYAAMIEAVDKSVGRLRDRIRALNLKNTVFIFSSDNGGLPRVSSNAPLHGGKGSLFEGGIRVATCMTWPGVIRPGSQTATPITSVDFLPSFAELAGAALPESQPVDGRSFVPLMTGDRDALRGRAIFWFYPLYLSGSRGNKVLPVLGTDRMFWRGVPSAAIVKDDWKLIRYFEDDSIKLFHVRQDVGEQNDRSATDAVRAKAMLSELNTWLKDTEAPVPTAVNPAFRPG